MEQQKNRGILDKAMFESGFEGISTEWWHFNLPDARTSPLANFQFHSFNRASYEVSYPRNYPFGLQI